jgi:hypothetical protein
MLRKWTVAHLIEAKDKKDRSVKSLMRRNAMSVTHLAKCIKATSRASAMHESSGPTHEILSLNI